MERPAHENAAQQNAASASTEPTGTRAPPFKAQARAPPAKAMPQMLRVNASIAGLSSPSDNLSPMSQRLVAADRMRGGPRPRSLRSMLAGAHVLAVSESSSCCDSPVAGVGAAPRTPLAEDVCVSGGSESDECPAGDSLAREVFSNGDDEDPPSSPTRPLARRP